MTQHISVPLEQLKKWHRDLDACQKVIWLAGCRPRVPGGFDPAYVEDAQASIAQMDAAMSAPQPPAVGEMPEVHRYQVVKMLSEAGNKIAYDPHGPWVVMEDAHRAHVTRLQAEVDRLTDALANHDMASKAMDAWVSEKGQMPWATAINMLAILTHMPDSERDRLLDMDDGSTERGALIAERDQLQARMEEMEGALKFYADREHYHLESDDWDTVSGEPQNILWHSEEPDFIEDGSVARAALGRGEKP